MQPGDSWSLSSVLASPTTAQLTAGQLLVEKISDQVYHREIEAIRAEVSELDAALIYIDTQICGEAHNELFSCDCNCCDSYWDEAFSICHKCRQHEIIRDQILKGKGEPPPAVILTGEELDRRFPQKFRSVATATARPAAKAAARAKGSHFNFSF